MLLTTLRSALASPGLADRSKVPVGEAIPAMSRSALSPRERLRAVAVVAPLPTAEESLILDVRGQLSPAQIVERKLVALLRGKGLLASHLQMAGLLRGRD